MIGQPDFISTAPNRGGVPAANTLDGAQTVSSNGTKLLICDYNNNRVLLFNSIPQSGDVSADIVIGQPNFTSTGSSTTQNSLDSPESAIIVNNRIIIADSGNNRILIYNSIPIANGANADIVLGQSDFTTSSNETTANGMNNPQGITYSGNKLFVLDFANNRCLIFEAN